MRIKIRNPIRGAIPASEIEGAYRVAFNVGGNWFIRFIEALLGKGQPFQFADTFYKEVDEALIKSILLEDKTDLWEYIAEDFDCDDFTFRLMGIFHQNIETAAMPIFITWVSTPEGGHAVLSYYAGGAVKIIEPQTDKVTNVPNSWRLMLLCG